MTPIMVAVMVATVALTSAYPDFNGSYVSIFMKAGSEKKFVLGKPSLECADQSDLSTLEFYIECCACACACACAYVCDRVWLFSHE